MPEKLKARSLQKFCIFMDATNKQDWTDGLVVVVSHSKQQHFTSQIPGVTLLFHHAFIIKKICSGDSYIDFFAKLSLIMQEWLLVALKNQHKYTNTTAWLSDY